MAEEEKEGLQAEENTGEADSQTDTGTPEKKTEPEAVDWEQRHKDLQADYTRKSQRIAELERDAQEREEAVKPPEEPPEEYGDDETFVDRKTVKSIVDDAVSTAISKERQTSADSYFRRTYPEFIDDEGAISGILRSPQHRKELLKCASSEDRVDFAVNKFKERLEKASADAKEEAETKAKEREEKNRLATGLGGPSTTPVKSDDEGKSDLDDLKDRKASLAKKRGLV